MHPQVLPSTADCSTPLPPYRDFYTLAKIRAAGNRRINDLKWLGPMIFSNLNDSILPSLDQLSDWTKAA